MKKMKRFNQGGETEFETKQGSNAALDRIAGIRERAMKAASEGGQKDEAPAPKAKPAVKKKAPKLYKPDYSNEDLDRMGMNEASKPVKAKAQPETDREEYPPFMQQFRKDEATAAASTKEVPELVRKAYQDAAKLVKPAGMKKGGKVAGRLATRGYGIAKK